MNKKEQQKLQREHQEDAVLNKVLIWIVGAVVLEFLMLLLNRYYVHYTPATISLAMTLRSVFRVLAVALPVCAVALGVWCFSLYKKGKSVRLAGFLTVLGRRWPCAQWLWRCSAAPVSAFYISAYLRSPC